MAATAKSKAEASPRRKPADSTVPSASAAPPARRTRKPSRKGHLDEAARATAHAQRLLAGLGTLTAALDKVAPLPDAERAERFSSLLADASAFTGRWLDRLAIKEDDRAWASSRLHEAFLHAAPAARGEESASATDAIVARALEHAAPATAQPAAGADLPMRLALACALLPVCAAQSDFGFLRKDPEDDMEEVASRVVAASDTLFMACTRGASPGAAAPEVRRMALSCCGTLMATAWRTEAAAAQDVFKRRGIDMRAWRRANPDGFPLAHVFKRFADLSAILERLVAKVAMKD